jgi:hypothetical protein
LPGVLEPICEGGQVSGVEGAAWSEHLDLEHLQLRSQLSLAPPARREILVALVDDLVAAIDFVRYADPPRRPGADELPGFRLEDLVISVGNHSHEEADRVLVAPLERRRRKEPNPAWVGIEGLAALAARRLVQPRPGTELEGPHEVVEVVARAGFCMQSFPCLFTRWGCMHSRTCLIDARADLVADAGEVAHATPATGVAD